jgi:hypothetical protein
VQNTGHQRPWIAGGDIYASGGHGDATAWSVFSLFIFFAAAGFASKNFSKYMRGPAFDLMRNFFRTAGTAPREVGQLRQQFARA